MRCSVTPAKPAPRSGRRLRGCSLFRSEQRHQDVCLHARPELKLLVVGDLFQQPVHLGAPHFLVRHLPATMEDHGLHFMAFAEELDDLVLPHLVIVLGGIGPKLHFLELRALVALALLMSLLVLLVEVLPVVGDLADRRVGRGRNLPQAETPPARHPHGLKRPHHPQPPTLFLYPPNFPRPNPPIYAETGAPSPTPSPPKSTSPTL